MSSLFVFYPPQSVEWKATFFPPPPSTPRTREAWPKRVLSSAWLRLSEWASALLGWRASSRFTHARTHTHFYTQAVIRRKQPCFGGSCCYCAHHWWKVAKYKGFVCVFLFLGWLKPFHLKPFSVFWSGAEEWLEFKATSQCNWILFSNQKGCNLKGGGQPASFRLLGRLFFFF